LANEKDQSVLSHIDQLVKKEERLYAKSGLTEDEQARLSKLKVELDQCWDLLRQRPARIVENYEQ
jgi:IS5 family transposase